MSTIHTSTTPQAPLTASTTNWDFTARGKFAADVLQALRDLERTSDAPYPAQLAGSVALALEVFAANATASAPEDLIWEVQTTGQVGVNYTLNISTVADPAALAAKEAKAKEAAQAQVQPQAPAHQAQTQDQAHSGSSTPGGHSSGRR